LIGSFVLLILVIAGGTFTFTYAQTKQALLDSTREDLRQLIGLVSTQVTAQDAAAISALKPGQDNAPETLALKQKFQNMRSFSPHIVNFYVLRVDGDKAQFLLDDLFAADDPALIGQAYADPDPRLFDAVKAPSVSDNLYTDEWGTFLSAYAPVKDANGATAFIVGADMEASAVIQRQNFIGSTIYYIMGIGILIAAVLIGLFSVTIIRDIKKLNKAAEKISMGDTGVNVDVNRKDEIGELANSFSRMLASLKILMALNEPPDINNPSSSI
jgi:methyl-accepting chemotaxis protein